MTDLVDRPTVGRYVLTKPLPRSVLAERWLAVHVVDQTSHVLYRFPGCHDKAEQRRFLGAVQRLAGIEHPHILRVEQFSFEVGGRPWVVTPFTGDVDGLVTLKRLLRDKGGEMNADEAERALTQLLEACQFAHDLGVHHGPVTMDEILVDRRGSLAIELYGMSRGLRGLMQGNAELVRDEVRSVIEIGYELITGIRAEEPLIPAARLVKRLAREWGAWFDEGLDPTAGFATAAEALSALPSDRAKRDARQQPVTVRTVIGRLRPARR